MKAELHPTSQATFNDSNMFNLKKQDKTMTKDNTETSN